MIESLNGCTNVSELPNLILIDDSGKYNLDYDFAIKARRLYKGKIFSIINDTNMGVSFSRNIGFSMVPIGSYVVFFDSDDTWIVGNYKKFISALKANADKDLILFPTSINEIPKYSGISMEVKQLLWKDYGAGERLLVIKKTDNDKPFIDKLRGFEIVSLYDWGCGVSRRSVVAPVVIRNYTSDNDYSLTRSQFTNERTYLSISAFARLVLLSVQQGDLKILHLALIRCIKWSMLWLYHQITIK